MKSRLFPRTVIGTVILLWVTIPAKAGPPLICHAIAIGQAKSLPQVGWNREGKGGYDLKNLTRDTLAILNSNTPVLVRMETLRRATLYARQDPQVAKELLTRLHMRAADGEAAGHPEAMAWFDLGYLAETYQQWMGRSEPNPARGLDGYAYVKRAISLRGSDPEMEFAATLITLSGPESDHREHLQKALAGAKNDPLLAQNLSSTFNGQAMSVMPREHPLAAQP
jgi:hypothetical protein